MGKLSEADFKEMSGRLRARAARLMRQLDAGAGYREQIERDSRRRLAAQQDAMDAKRRRSARTRRHDGPSRFCSCVRHVERRRREILQRLRGASYEARPSGNAAS